MTSSHYSKNRIGITLLVVLLLSIGIATALTVTNTGYFGSFYQNQWNTSNSIENITFTGGDNHTLYVKLPKYIEVNRANINLSSEDDLGNVNISIDNQTISASLIFSDNMENVVTGYDTSLWDAVNSPTSENSVVYEGNYSCELSGSTDERIYTKTGLITSEIFVFEAYVYPEKSDDRNPVLRIYNGSDFSCGAGDEEGHFGTGSWKRVQYQFLGEGEVKLYIDDQLNKTCDTGSSWDSNYYIEIKNNDATETSYIDSVAVWAGSYLEGTSNVSNSSFNVAGFAEQINNYVNSCSEDADGYCYVPFTFFSNYAGDLSADIGNTINFSILYNESYNVYALSPYDNDYELILHYNDPSASAQLLVDNYSTVVSPTFDGGQTIFTKTFYYDGSSLPRSILKAWNLTLPELNYTSAYLNSANQTGTEVFVEDCSNDLTNYSVTNFFYKDEVTDDLINASTTYNLQFYDGIYSHNASGQFNESDDHEFCSNLNGSLQTFNWNMFGTVTVEKDEYITRVYTISEDSPVLVSNNPPVNQTFYLINESEGTPITFTWLTEEFQYIDGTMQIYRCGESRELVESVPIVSGIASASLQLYTQTYSYEVLIDGVTYTSSPGWTDCHTESQTERTYYVDVNQQDVSGVVGFGSIYCHIEKIDNETARLTWEQNSEDLSTYVEGCIIGTRQNLGLNTEVFENCSESGNTYDVSVQNNGNTYLVYGEIRQNGYTLSCGSVVFSASDQPGGVFGSTGLIAAFFLICSLMLIYAGNGEKQLIGGFIGLIVAFVLGIMVINWVYVATIMVILGIIIAIGRHSRKN